MKNTLKMKIGLLIITFISTMLFYYLPWLNTTEDLKVYAAGTDDVKLNTKEYTMGIDNDIYIFKFLDNYNDDAKYSCQSSNTKVVQIKDNYEQLVAKSIGSATITVKETLDNESRVIGKLKVKVVGASVDKEINMGLSGSENTVGYLFPINNERPGATYSYKSSDTSIIEVNKYGNVSTKKYGSAYVTVTENYKGKVTKLGKVKVNIVKAEPMYKKITIPVNTDGFTAGVLVKYPNNKSTICYIFTSSNPKLLEWDGVNSTETTLIAKNHGTVKLKIEEMNLSTKKKTYIGTTTVEIVPSKLDPDFKYYELEYDQPKELWDIISLHCQYINLDATYSCKAEDSSVLSVSKHKEKNLDTEKYKTYYDVTGIKNGGKTKLTVYEEYKGKKTEIGSFTVEVRETVDEFTFYGEIDDFSDGMYNCTMYLNDQDEYNLFTNLGDVIIKTPYEDMSTVIFSSSNDNVIKIDKKGNIELISEGTAVLTATCGDKTLKLKVTVEND